VEKATSIKEAGIRVMVREIPLISWAQAGIAARYEEIPEEWQEHIWAAVNDRQAFAIQLRGDSMEPKFSEGDVVVLMPNIPARNGDLVVANIVDEGFAFKILNVVGGDFQKLRLSSYNQAYPPMDYDREQFHWIYPVHSVNKVIRR
jgi:phage repressor protein C with HTH and peptisase S24 domain